MDNLLKSIISECLNYDDKIFSCILNIKNIPDDSKLALLEHCLNNNVFVDAAVKLCAIDSIAYIIFPWEFDNNDINPETSIGKMQKVISMSPNMYGDHIYKCFMNLHNMNIYTQIRFLEFTIKYKCLHHHKLMELANQSLLFLKHPFLYSFNESKTVYKSDVEEYRKKIKLIDDEIRQLIISADHTCHWCPSNCPFGVLPSNLIKKEKTQIYENALRGLKAILHDFYDWDGWDSCPITLERMTHPITLSCGHTFDAKTIEKLQSNTCPFCRRIF